AHTSGSHLLRNISSWHARAPVAPSRVRDRPSTADRSRVSRRSLHRLLLQGIRPRQIPLLPATRLHPLQSLELHKPSLRAPLTRTIPVPTAAKTGPPGSASSSLHSASLETRRRSVCRVSAPMPRPPHGQARRQSSPTSRAFFREPARKFLLRPESS